MSNARGGRPIQRGGVKLALCSMGLMVMPQGESYTGPRSGKADNRFITGSKPQAIRCCRCHDNQVPTASPFFFPDPKKLRTLGIAVPVLLWNTITGFQSEVVPDDKMFYSQVFSLVCRVTVERVDLVYFGSVPH